MIDTAHSQRVTRCARAAALTPRPGFRKCLIPWPPCPLATTSSTARYALERGISNFVRLHERAIRRRWYEGAAPVVLCAFDLVVYAGEDVRGLPLEERKAILADLVADLPSVLYVSAIDDGAAAWAAVQALKLEGILAKRAGSLYAAGPSPDWLKIKRPGATLPGFKRNI